MIVWNLQLNSLCPNADIRRQRSWSTLVQVMAITWTNVHLSPVRSIASQLREISPGIAQLSITAISLKNAYMKFKLTSPRGQWVKKAVKTLIPRFRKYIGNHLEKKYLQCVALENIFILYELGLTYYVKELEKWLNFIFVLFVSRKWYIDYPLSVYNVMIFYTSLWDALIFQYWYGNFVNIIVTIWNEIFAIRGSGKIDRSADVTCRHTVVYPGGQGPAPTDCINQYSFQWLYSTYKFKETGWRYFFL